MQHTLSNTVVSRTLNDAWREVLECCARNGYDYVIEHGSYAGQIRRQLDNLMLRITEPNTRPFVFHTPTGIPSPTDEDNANKYFANYLMSDVKSDNEDYTYGMYITAQIEQIIEKLNQSNGNTNQATLNIGGIENISMGDPPCLRLMDFKVVNGKLNLTCYFRSWDLFVGLPENLSGFTLLMEYVLMNLKFPCECGELIVYSAGAHIYEMYFEIINCLNANKILIDKEI